MAEWSMMALDSLTVLSLSANPEIDPIRMGRIV